MELRKYGIRVWVRNHGEWVYGIMRNGNIECVYGTYRHWKCL